MTIIEFTADFDRADFDCGDPTLNSYIRERAGQDRRRGLNQTYLLIDDQKLAGFYTVSPHALAMRELPSKTAKKFPVNLLLPCYLIGRLAVDKSRQAQGLGKLLLGEALRVIALTAQKIGGYCAVVEAKNDRAQAFYESYNFRRTAENSRRLFLPIAEIDPKLLTLPPLLDA
ncbi:N-acetyltransferase [Planctomycetales bacterium]|nr:N-acetyltransferase [Planctomycetales bacterium]